MAKFYGKIGYAETTETEPGIWEEVITERDYYGDIIKMTKRWQSSDQLNDNLEINNTISIIADPYATQHFHAMRYIVWMGASWKITSVEVQRPRLLLSIGGVYNGNQS